MSKKSYIYILANKKDGVIYTGVTNDLCRRIYEHKSKLTKGFTQKYNTDKLVYYETFDLIENAIIREKQIKGGSRKNKIALIEKDNFKWEDLYTELCL